MEEAMSDVSSGARAPDVTPDVNVPAGPVVDPAYPTTSTSTTAGTYPAATGTTGGSRGGSKARQVAGQSTQAAGEAASDVKDTAKEQAQRVAGEATNQVRNVASDVRDRVSDQAHTQNDKLVSSIRQAADQLDEMRGDRQGSPAAEVVSRVADGGRRLADYLDRNGPEGVLREVQDFARRRPGAFLATALAAGFVVGRLGKGVAKADRYVGSSKPGTDSFVSTAGSDTSAGYAAVPGYETATAGYAAEAVPNAGYATGTEATGTEYASTGTGTPVAVEQEYVLENPPADRDYPGGVR
jgi:uncharacterized protein YjbJ (UPF0337 family)